MAFATNENGATQCAGCSWTQFTDEPERHSPDCKFRRKSWSIKLVGVYVVFAIIALGVDVYLRTAAERQGNPVWSTDEKGYTSQSLGPEFPGARVDAKRSEMTWKTLSRQTEGSVETMRNRNDKGEWVYSTAIHCMKDPRQLKDGTSEIGQWSEWWISHEDLHDRGKIELVSECKP